MVTKEGSSEERVLVWEIQCVSYLGLPTPGCLRSLLPPLAAWDRREQQPAKATCSMYTLAVGDGTWPGSVRAPQPARLGLQHLSKEGS